MYKIKTMNAIASKGLEILRNAGCAVGPDTDQPQALLIRSAVLHGASFGPELLCIARAGAGTNNIPVDSCAQEGIVVFNTPGANAEAVKEMAICALLLASRDVLGGVEWVQSILDQKDQVPALVEREKNRFIGPELSGKSLGVIGLGAVGARVANAALNLDMDVYGYDPYLSVDAAWNLSSKVRHVTDVNVIYRNCDYISIHVPYMPSTHHTLNRDTLGKMRPGVRVLNLARGELVDDEAMLEALESGKVARYVTDFPNAQIAGAKNVVAFPHLAATTPEAEEKCAVMAAEQILDYLQNGNIRNSVNLPNASLDRLGASRLCIFHKNQPKMLNQFLEIIAERNINVEHMLNKARGDYAYTIFDTGVLLDETMVRRVQDVPGVTRVRLL